MPSARLPSLDPPQGMASLDAVLDRLDRSLSPLVGTQDVPLSQALGRLLAAPIRARQSHPAFDASAMDGVCFAHASLTGSTTGGSRGTDAPIGPEDAEDAAEDAAGLCRLPLVARIAAGHPLDAPLPPGTAARIFTGAPLPDGADTVVMQEDCRFETDASGAETTVCLPRGAARSIPPGACVRRAGEDFAAGSSPLHPGRRLGPRDIAMAGACGVDRLTVYTPLRVGVFSTGDEILEPGSPPRPGHLYNANRPGLMAAVTALGAMAEDLGHLPDDPTAIAAALTAAADRCDVLLTSGGVSVGGEDHVVAVVRALGRLDLWRVAIKPGKPTALGQVGSALFIGLPGTPVSALVTFYLIARPLLLRLAGATAVPMAPPRVLLPAAFHFTKSHGRRQFLRARLTTPPLAPPLASPLAGDSQRAADSGPTAAPGPALVLHHGQEGHMLSSLVDADGLVDVPADCCTIHPGDRVAFLPFAVLESGCGGGWSGQP